jgi:hypothetical protein
VGAEKAQRKRAARIARRIREIESNPAPSDAHLPRTCTLEGQNAGAMSGREGRAIVAAMLGATALVTGVATAAASQTLDAAPPGPNPAAPDHHPGGHAPSTRVDLSGVATDTDQPVAIARDVLFGANDPSSSAPSLDAVRHGAIITPSDRGASVLEVLQRLDAIGIRGSDAAASFKAFQKTYGLPQSKGFDARSLETLEKAEAVTEAGRTGTGKAWVDGREVGDIQLRYIDGKPVEESTANALRPMFVTAARSNIHLHVVSGYRTFEEQRALYFAYLHHHGDLAAEPGYSNHGAGIAVDLNTQDRGVYGWLARHAKHFDFERTVPSERWHWEYRPR